MKYASFLSRLLMIVISTTCMLPSILYAQEETMKAKQDFSFVYIAHDPDTKLESLTPRIRNSYNIAVSQQVPTIFYLANGNSPIIVKVNFEDSNEEDFDKVLIKELQENTSHNVNGSYDHDRIHQLLTIHNFADEEGQLIYQHVNFDFYAGSTFWTLKNNEHVIAALFFELNIAHYINSEGRMSFHVNCPRAASNIDPDIPFGLMNLDGINEKISLTRY